ncbi:MAG TPA: NAD-dependent epimerase/dehydratase family protein [Bryobacteraceae bacterium]|nr:NAD-dependent epimerase/dehydratase family protein [Bryobacteraceae bacterium]
MNVLLTGATGYIGTAVAEALAAAGHQVIGLARSDESAVKLENRGIRVARGDVRQPETVADAARAADAMIHTALPNTPDAGDVDRAMVERVLFALEGSGKPFVFTSGVWVYGSTGEHVADENTPLNPPPLVAWRPAVERMVLESASRGVGGVVVRPAMVYGRGGGVAMMFVNSAREHGAAHIVGDAGNRWPWVHVDDLADLYVRLLHAPPGTLVVASAGPAVRVRDVAETASRAAGAGGKVEAIPLEEAHKNLGLLADALALDQQVASRRAAELLAWLPKSPGVLEEIARM